MKYFASLFLVVLMMTACNQTANEQNANSQTQTDSPASNVETYPGLPLEIAQSLLANCTYIDYLYYTLPISMSFNEPSGIRSAISHISDSPAPVKSNCKPIGRIFYQNGDESLLEAEIYFTPDCVYFTFLEDGKAKYGNLMTTDAVKFYEGMLKQVSAQPKK